MLAETTIEMLSLTDEEKSLPEGWRFHRLSDVCELNPTRSSLADKLKDRSDNTPTSFVQMSAVDERLGIIARPEVKPFGQIKKGYTIFAEDDVLFAKITPCMQNGKHAIARDLIDGFGFGSTEFHVLRPTEKIISNLLHYFLRQPSVLNAAMASFTGTVGQQRVPENFIANLQIPLPPTIKEQRRVASILDEQMKAVEQARLAVEKQLADANRLSNAFLRAVFEGEEARHWQKRNLDEVCRDISDGTHFTPEYISSGVPFLSVKDVKETGISFNSCRYISQEQHQQLCRRCKPERGDVLYTKVGTTGIAKAIDIDTEFSIFVSVALLKLNEGICPFFLEKALNSPLGKAQADDLTQGMANRNLVIRDIRTIEIPVPETIEEQKRIVEKLNEQMHAAETLKKSLIEKLAAVKHLPAALLRKAFAGGI